VGQDEAHRLKRRRAQPGDQGPRAAVGLPIPGAPHDGWRAVAQAATVRAILGQSWRHKPGSARPAAGRAAGRCAAPRPGPRRRPGPRSCGSPSALWPTAGAPARRPSGCACPLGPWCAAPSDPYTCRQQRWPAPPAQGGGTGQERCPATHRRERDGGQRAAGAPRLWPQRAPRAATGTGRGPWAPWAPRLEETTGPRALPAGGPADAPRGWPAHRGPGRALATRHAPGRDIASRVCVAARHHRGHPASGGGRGAGRGETGPRDRARSA